jgi:hypothetical protein
MTQVSSWYGWKMKGLECINCATSYRYRTWINYLLRSQLLVSVPFGKTGRNNTQQGKFPWPPPPPAPPPSSSLWMSFQLWRFHICVYLYKEFLSTVLQDRRHPSLYKSVLLNPAGTEYSKKSEQNKGKKTVVKSRWTHLIGHFSERIDFFIAFYALHFLWLRTILVFYLPRLWRVCSLVGCLLGSHVSCRVGSRVGCRVGRQAPCHALQQSEEKDPLACWYDSIQVCWQRHSSASCCCVLSLTHYCCCPTTVLFYALYCT